MVCCCICCGGEGFCSNLISVMASLTFSFHAFGIVSPHWVCKGDDCVKIGLLYSCNGGSCERSVDEQPALLTLALIVLVSSLLLVIVLCAILHCSQFRWKSMTPTLAVFVGTWYIVQETLTLAILITLGVRYESVLWSAYVFCLPGIIFLGVVIICLVYMMCKPEHRVFPE